MPRALTQQLLVQIAHAAADLKQRRVGKAGQAQALDELALRGLEAAARVASPVTTREMAEEFPDTATRCATTAHAISSCNLILSTGTSTHRDVLVQHRAGARLARVVS